MRALRRLAFAVVLAAIVVTIARRRRPQEAADAPVWPPLDVIVRAVPLAEEDAVQPIAFEPVEIEADVVVIEAVVDAEELDEPDVVEIGQLPMPPTWVLPVNGECPADHPIKVNSSSGIYHVPGGRSYARTKPERCYATPEDAEADGFRRAKL